MNMLQATIEHLCHKIFPYAITIFLLSVTLGLNKWEPYVIIALMFFVQKYNFKIGYYSCLLEQISTNKYEEISEMEE